MPLECSFWLADNNFLQGRVCSAKFDPDGEYVRRWVPELEKLPTMWIHEPWRARESAIVENYPPPIVDHAEARRAALEAFATIREKDE